MPLLMGRTPASTPPGPGPRHETPTWGRRWLMRRPPPPAMALPRRRSPSVLVPRLGRRAQASTLPPRATGADLQTTSRRSVRSPGGAPNAARRTTTPTGAGVSAVAAAARTTTRRAAVTVSLVASIASMRVVHRSTRRPRVRTSHAATAASGCISRLPVLSCAAWFRSVNDAISSVMWRPSAASHAPTARVGDTPRTRARVSPRSVARCGSPMTLGVRMQEDRGLRALPGTLVALPPPPPPPAAILGCPLRTMGGTCLLPRPRRARPPMPAPLRPPPVVTRRWTNAAIRLTSQTALRVPRTRAPIVPAATAGLRFNRTSVMVLAAWVLATSSRRTTVPLRSPLPTIDGLRPRPSSRRASAMP